MAQGMWTKRYTPEGTAFYYNSTLNKSEWNPPLNGITHNAEKLQIPREGEQQKRFTLSICIYLALLSCDYLHVLIWLWFVVENYC